MVWATDTTSQWLHSPCRSESFHRQDVSCIIRLKHVVLSNFDLKQIFPKHFAQGKCWCPWCWHVEKHRVECKLVLYSLCIWLVSTSRAGCAACPAHLSSLSCKREALSCLLRLQTLEQLCSCECRDKTLAAMTSLTLSPCCQVCTEQHC